LKPKDLIIEALKDQKEIFGDELFTQISFSDMSEKIALSHKEEQNQVKEEPKIYMVKEFQSAKSIDELESKICECQKCELGSTRNKFVFGSGNPNADIMCIGEAPGADEDAQGLPFVGRAGKLLTDILKAIIFREMKFL
jgi:hypothetical protein